MAFLNSPIISGDAKVSNPKPYTFILGAHALTSTATANRHNAQMQPVHTNTAYRVVDDCSLRDIPKSRSNREYHKQKSM